MRAKAEKRIDRICVACNKHFTVAPSRLRSSPNQGRWCSMACRGGAGGWHSSKGKRIIGVSDEQIVSEYQSGMSVLALSEKYNVSNQPIYKALRLSGIDLRGSEGMNNWAEESRQKSIERSRQQFIDNNPRKRNDLPTEDICKAYQNGESSARIAARYRCDPEAIIDRVRAAGIPIRPPGYVSHVQCTDGHIADSQWEADVDNWLSSHGIAHTVHPKVPWYTPATKGHSDFLVGNIYIEVWGIHGNARYDRRREYKVAQYHACGAGLIQLFPHHMISGDFSPLESLLA